MTAPAFKFYCHAVRRYRRLIRGIFADKHSHALQTSEKAAIGPPLTSIVAPFILFLETCDLPSKYIDPIDCLALGRCLLPLDESGATGHGLCEVKVASSFLCIDDMSFSVSSSLCNSIGP